MSTKDMDDIVVNDRHELEETEQPTEESVLSYGNDTLAQAKEDLLTPEESEDDLIDEGSDDMDGDQVSFDYGEEPPTPMNRTHLSPKEMEDSLQQVEESEVIPVVKNARIRENIVSQEPTSEFVASILKEMGEHADLNILPSTLLSNDVRDTTIKYISAIKAGDEKMADRYHSILRGIQSNSDVTGVGEGLFNDPDAVLEQGLYNPDTGDVLGFKELTSNVKGNHLRGQAALLTALGALGLGKPIHIPLPHSGFWVNILPAGEWDMVSFQEALGAEKLKLGRDTQGFIFNNMSVAINQDLYKFILENIKESNLKDVDNNELMKYININDLPILVWGFAKTMYPQGFPFRRRCDKYILDKDGVNVGVCDHIEEVNLSLDKLFHLRNDLLTDSQKATYRKRGKGSVTVEELKSYADQFRETDISEFTFRNVKVILRSPTVYDYFKDGMEWLDDITDEYERALIRKDYDAKGRAEMLSTYVNASSLRNYSHFIDKIVVGDKSISEREDISLIISKYGENKEFTLKFVDAVIRHRNKSIIAGIGIEEYKCPKCDHEQVNGEDSDHLKHVIPLSPTSLFFLMFTIKYQMLTVDLGLN